MKDDIKVDQVLRLAMYDLMLTLYNQGITEIHMGGLMRLMGVPNESAIEHDEERVILDDKFVEYVHEIKKPVPAGQTIH